MTDAADFFEFSEPSKHRDKFDGYGRRNDRVRVVKPRAASWQTDPKGLYVNCTFSDDNWQEQLSPFCLGPCRLYGGRTSRCMENGWQFAKVYSQHVGEDGRPTSDYFHWAT